MLSVHFVLCSYACVLAPSLRCSSVQFGLACSLPFLHSSLPLSRAKPLSYASSAWCKWKQKHWPLSVSTDLSFHSKVYWKWLQHYSLVVLLHEKVGGSLPGISLDKVWLQPGRLTKSKLRKRSEETADLYSERANSLSIVWSLQNLPECLQALIQVTQGVRVGEKLRAKLCSFFSWHLIFGRFRHCTSVEVFLVRNAARY